MRVHVPILAGLLAITVLLYGRTLDDEWHLDDRAELEWPGVREGAPEVLPGHYRGRVVLWTWAANHRISGADPWSYHLVNLLIHFGNAALVYALALGWSRPRDGTRRLFAGAAAVVFAAHPLASEPVAYVTQRSTSLATLFLLGSLAGWRGLREGSGRGRWIAGMAAVAAFASGLHTKPLVLAAPALAVAAERWRSPRRALDRAALIVAAVAAALAVWRAAELAPRVGQWVTGTSGGTAGAAAAGLPGVHRFGAAEYARTQPAVVLRYLSLMVWPTGQNLDHDVQPVGSAADAGFLVPAGVLLGLAAVAFRARHAHPAAAFGALFALVTLAPTSSVVPSADLMFEHRAYAALAGLALVVGGMAVALWRRRHGWIVLAAAGLVLGGATWQRVSVWDTELSLWADAARKSPGKPRAEVNLGLALQGAGRLDEAAAAYARALAKRPDHPLALNNLGNVRRAQGRPSEAEELFRAAIAAHPAAAEPWINLGNMAMERGDALAAEQLHRRALALDPRSILARYDLAKSLEVQGRHAEALREYESVASRRPDDAVFANDLGCARLACGDVAGAERELRRAVALDDRWPVPLYNLGLALEARGAGAEAAAAFEAALARDPRMAPARAMLGRVRGETADSGDDGGGPGGR